MPNENTTEGNAQAYGTLDLNVTDIVSPNENTTEGNAQAYGTLDVNVADVVSSNENTTEGNAHIALAYSTLDLYIADMCRQMRTRQKAMHRLTVDCISA